MKWRALSESGGALVRQLAVDSRAWLGRTRKIVLSLHALRDLGEPGAISMIFGFLLDDDATVAKETATVLQELFRNVPLEFLPTLDERMRADGYWGYFSGSPPLSPGDLNRLCLGADASVPLGLASCHGSGYVRQRAVERLDREVASGREISFLLLRLNDWVAVVRSTAERAIGQRLSLAHRVFYLENLPLIVRLRGRSRVGESAAFARIEKLLVTDLPSLLSVALHSPDRMTTKVSLSLAWSAAGEKGESEQAQVIEQVIRSVSPGIRLMSTCWLASVKAAPELARRFLPQLIEDRFVAVRRVALAWCATREPRSHVRALHAALLDPSPMVRSIAQFHLPKLEPIDLRDFYRQALGRRDARVLKAAFGGLGETGVAGDADLIVPTVDAAEIGVRKAALGALARLALETHLEIFISALQAKSPGVSRQARIAMQPQAGQIGANRLEAIFNNTPHHHVRVQTLALIHRLSKWQEVPLLVEIFAQQNDALRLLAENYLHSWLTGFNRTHQLQPSNAETARLRSALAAHGDKLEHRIGRELRGIAEALRSN